MDKLHYNEMVNNLNRLEETGLLAGRRIFLFGHCNATEELADLLMERRYAVCAILDNNESKHHMDYKGIRILPPGEVLRTDGEEVIVCIVARAYAAMNHQLRKLGFRGVVEKLIDYDSYAEYSLADDTIRRKRQRVERGIRLLEQAKEKYQGMFRLYCPFQALGDVYYMMAYLPYFLERRKIREYVVFTIGTACARVAGMFGADRIEALTQKDMDEQIQAVLYTRDIEAFIPHQDRPYVANLYKALYIKKIPLEMIYRCGVFSLSEDCEPYRPCRLEQYERLDEIPEGKAVILSPYAKSVTNIPGECWEQIIRYLTRKGYVIYTNTAGEEKPLPGTNELSDVPLERMQSLVERAGMFIGIRSGLCDVIKWADCKKAAIYPEAFYSDTKWRMDEMYHLEGWENIVVTGNGDIISEIDSIVKR